MVEKLMPMIQMLEKYAKPYDVVYTNFPGRIVYEDKWQVAVYDEKTSGTIQELSASHLPLYAEVIRKSFATAADELGLTQENCPNHTSFITDEQLAGKIGERYYPFGYFEDGKLIGFVSLTDIGNGIFELNHLAVLPDMRHLGYGGELIEFCKKKVKEWHGKKITIGIVEENIVLKEWYVKNRFEQVGTKKFEHLPFTVGYMEWNEYL